MYLIISITVNKGFFELSCFFLIPPCAMLDAVRATHESRFYYFPLINIKIVFAMFNALLLELASQPQILYIWISL